MKGFPLVFSFTFKRITGEKKFKSWTAILAVLLFLLPAVILPLAERGREDGTEKGGEEIDVYDPDALLRRVSSLFYTADTEDGFSWDSPILFSGVPTTHCPDMETVRKSMAEGGFGAFGLLIYERRGEYQILGITEDDVSNDDRSTASALAESFSAALPLMLAEEMHLDPAQKDALRTSVIFTDESGGQTDDSGADFKLIAGMLLPYVNMMLIYFLVILYGNTVANHVILEKTSKLMDTFLISVRPRAMILGKVLAAWASSLFQLLVWIAAGTAGCGLGAFLARRIHPNSTMGILRFIDYLGKGMKLFSPLHALTALLLIAAGFLLYCALAGVAGSFAGKQEELASAMQIFNLLLVISFFIVLSVILGGGMGTPEKTMWYDFVPFTAILITPARLLLGQIPLWIGLISLALTTLLALLTVFLSGKVYSMMSLYKGSFPKPQEMLKIIFSRS